MFFPQESQNWVDNSSIWTIWRWALTCVELWKAQMQMMQHLYLTTTAPERTHKIYFPSFVTGSPADRELAQQTSYSPSSFSCCKAEGRTAAFLWVRGTCPLVKHPPTYVPSWHACRQTQEETLQDHTIWLLHWGTDPNYSALTCFDTHKICISSCSCRLL